MRMDRGKEEVDTVRRAALLSMAMLCEAIGGMVLEVGAR